MGPPSASGICSITRAGCETRIRYRALRVARRRIFASVLDSGFLHLLDSDETDRFIADLREAIAPGGRYYLHAFAIEFPIDNVPRAITEDEIRARFTHHSGWRVVEIRNAVFHNRVAQPTAAIVACIERLAG